MRWGNGTEAQQFHGSTDDLCLHLVSVGHAQDTTPGVRTYGKHGYVQQQVFLCVGSSCNCASPCIPVVLFAERWSIHMRFLCAS